MSSTDPAAPARLWPAGTDPAAWVRSWTAAFVPQNLVQPILPGWTFNINSNNSSAPQTEAEVVQRHSYGRQLGRIADALAVLLAAAPAKVREDESVQKFVELKADIDAVKRDAAAARVRRLGADLDLLKKADPDEYRRLRQALLRTLDAA
ncbi:MAG: hypothetical protein KF788_07035 [Piscinibacter sp.]|nr:hypothetical protein [Piscinibacter sp.]